MSYARLLAAFLLLALSNVPASAHAVLRKAVPAAGSTVQIIPKAIALQFSEAVEPGLCHVVVRDATGAALETGAPQTVPGDAKRLVVPLKLAKPGAYSVEWHAVSVDTHASDGHFRFTVAP
jgi:methionine-rich copper-binding protein CopC